MSDLNAEVPVAIIGMSCRFSGNATDPEKLWELVAEGRSGWSEIPSERFNVDGFWHPFSEKINSMNVKGGHFLDEDVGLFDAAFFGLPAETAASLDPQFRIQLESTYEALENAGIKLDDIAGSNTSMFGGTFFRDYHDSGLRDPETMPRFHMVGVGSAMASNRISHFYDFQGTSFSLDTGCSTTLVALHQACQSLRARESDISVVGGSNVMLNPDNFIALSSLRLISPSGKSYAFDDRASGYGRGEGSATIILKRLDDAVRDRDPIRGVIRGTGTNQDGRTDTITTPSQEAQEKLMRSVYETTGLDPRDTTYVEAHGTGTPTGDPIECRAIASVFNAERSRQQPLRIGSIKTNIGHTETASGLAAIIKTALALEREQIPPSINFENPNPNIHLDEWNLKVQRELEAWPTGERGIQRASINNFGYGGANAHVILESHRSYLSQLHENVSASIEGGSNGHSNGTHGHGNGVKETNGHKNGANKISSLISTNGTNGTDGPIASVPETYKLGSRVFVLSAKDESSAHSMASNLKRYVSTSPSAADEDSFLADLAYTLGERRSVFEWIAACPANSTADLIQAIESGKMKPTRTRGGRPRVGLVFTGQGAQWHAMGRELIPAYPVFRDCLLEAEAHLRQFGCPWSLMDELDQPASTSRVNEPAKSMPLCTAVQIALVRLLRSWGVEPAGITSHSSGEIAAAYAAGALTLKDAMAIVFARGSPTSEASDGLLKKVSGGMLAVGLGAEDIEARYLPRVSSGQVVVACLNSPTSTTVSGDVPGIEELEGTLKEDKVFVRRLKVNAAYHSHHMAAIQDVYLMWLRKLLQAEPGTKMGVIYTSPTTGTRMSSSKILSRPEHWVRSLVNPVQFIKAFTDMCLSDQDNTLNIDMVIEVGPHSALGGPIAEIVGQPEFGGIRLPYYSCLVRNSNAVHTMQSLASNLIRQGHPLNMGAVNLPCGPRSVRVLHDLPPYAWNHKTRHWAETRLNKSHRSKAQGPHDLLGSLAMGTNPLSPSWRHIVRTLEMPWTRHHTIQDTMVYPGGGFICMAIEGACQMTGDTLTLEQRIGGIELRDVDIMAALGIPDTTEGIEMQLSVRPSRQNEDFSEFSIYSVTENNKWTEHCKGFIKVHVESVDSPGASRVHRARPGLLPRRMADYRKRLDARDLYESMSSVGIQHGPIFQNLKEIRSGQGKAVSVIQVPDTAAVMPHQHQHDHIIHPVTLDTIFQSAYAAIPGAGSRMATALLPRSIKRLWIAGDMPSAHGRRLRTHADVNTLSAQKLDADLTVTEDRDAETRAVLAIDGMVFQSIGQALPRVLSPWEGQDFSLVEWAPDFSLLSGQALQKQLLLDDGVSACPADIDHLCMAIMSDAVNALTVQEVEQMQPLQQEHCAWIKTQLTNGSGSIDRVIGPTERDALIQSSGATGELVAFLGRHLLDIINGATDATKELLKLLSQSHLETNICGQQVGALVKSFVHTNPRGRILEINAGVGAVTQHVVQHLGTPESPLASSYEFTDSTSQFFAHAKQMFAQWDNIMSYSKVDIEQLPKDLAEASYDLIIANQVPDHVSLRNMGRLLQPHGKLILTEAPVEPLHQRLISGLLTGRRSISTSPTMQQCESSLSNAGLDINVSAGNLLMASQSSNIPNISSDIVIVAEESSSSYLDHLKSCLYTLTGKMPLVQPLASAICRDRLVIFLSELADPVLKDPTDAQFSAVKAMCIDSKGLIWVTKGAMMDGNNLYSSLSIGFLRCIRVEYHGKRVVSLDLDPDQDSWSLESANHVARVFGKVFDYSVEEPMADFEFAVRDGVVHIPRYYKDAERNQDVLGGDTETREAALVPFSQKERPLRLGVQSDKLVFSDNVDCAQELPADFIELAPRAFAIRSQDLSQDLDHQDSVSGCAGIMTKAGSVAAQRGGFRPGDRVAALSGGSVSNTVRVHWTNAVAIPDSMDFDEASTAPTACAVAHMTLVSGAQLKKGENVLIHMASGGLGEAVVRRAQRIGATVFVVANTREFQDALTAALDLGPNHILCAEDGEFVSRVFRMTQGKGVDAVIDMHKGRKYELAACVAPFGCFVEARDYTRQPDDVVHLGRFPRGVSFYSLDLSTIGARQNESMHEMLNSGIKDGICGIWPVTRLILSDLSKSTQISEYGRRVVTIEPQELVPVIPYREKAKFRSDASYVVVGGLGGLGKALCFWMAQRGVKNLIVVSRSAGGKAQSLVDDLSQLGCKVKAVSCDISDKASLAKGLESCENDMPPVRGVVQGAMVLQDSILEQMDLSAYLTATRPKVQGSWNLHEQFSEDQLDFFIILSSLAAVIGFASQCNYSAGGTFEDALARYRTLQGMPSVSIDIGVVLNVGVVAENDSIEERLRKSGHTLLSEEDVLQAFESAIVSPPASSQIMIGLNPEPGPHWEYSGMARDARFMPLKYEGQSKKGAVKATGSGLGSAIASADTLEDAAGLIVHALKEKLMEIFMVSEIFESDSLSDQGVDSLVAVELRNMLALKAGSQVSIFDIMSSTSIADLATMAARKSSFIDQDLVV